MDIDIPPGASAAGAIAKHTFPHPHLFEIVAEDVELVKKLKDDDSGLGELWRGKLLHLDVVVKAFPLTGMTNKDVNQFLAALQRAVAASLEGHHLARFYGWMLKDMKLCLVMRPYSGGLLKRIVDRTGTMPFPEALKGGISVAKSLVELHEAGLVAGNLKPQNVLYDNCGDFYLSDYGLFTWYQVAAVAKDANPKYKTIWCQYAAPEVMKYTGKEVVSDKADVWSLACLLIHMLDSRPPWGSLTHEEIATQVLKNGKKPRLPAKLPAKLSELLNQALSHDATQRPTSKQFLTVLLDCMILYGFKGVKPSDADSSSNGIGCAGGPSGGRPRNHVYRMLVLDGPDPSSPDSPPLSPSTPAINTPSSQSQEQVTSEGKAKPVGFMQLFSLKQKLPPGVHKCPPASYGRRGMTAPSGALPGVKATPPAGVISSKPAEAKVADVANKEEQKVKPREHVEDEDDDTDTADIAIVPMSGLEASKRKTSDDDISE